MRRTAKRIREEVREVPSNRVMNDLQNEAILFSLRIGQWRIRKNAEKSKVDTTAERRLLNVRKRILDSDEYRAINNADTQAREFVLRQSVPSPLGRGVYLLPLALVSETMRWLSVYQGRRGALIDQFLEVYPAQRDAMEKALGDMYDVADYPDEAEIRRRFWVETLMMQLDAPTALKGISGALYDEEVARIATVWEEARASISTALYQEMQELVGTLAERLAESKDGKEQRLRGSVVEKFQSWLDLFTARNLTRDGQLADLVDRARGIVAGLEVETIREDKKLRAALAGQFAGLKLELGAAIENRPTRKIRIAED
jgi:hypothetical protein